MASEFKRTLVTAALPYANGPIHLGHLAGCYLPSDIYVRFKRLKGEEVAFVCGSDEHGMAITMKARKEGVTPREIVDRYHAMMRDALADFGIAFDHYSRTSSDRHKQVASDFFKTLYEKGVFESRQTDQRGFGHQPLAQRAFGAQTIERMRVGTRRPMSAHHLDDPGQRLGGGSVAVQHAEGFAVVGAHAHLESMLPEGNARTIAISQVKKLRTKNDPNDLKAAIVLGRQFLDILRKETDRGRITLLDEAEARSARDATAGVTAPSNPEASTQDSGGQAEAA